MHTQTSASEKPGHGQRDHGALFVRFVGAVPVMKACFFSLLLASSATVPASAEGPMVEPGTDFWREVYDPPYIKPTEIPKDMPLRKQLFDLLRPAIERQAKRKIQFTGSLTAFRNWAIFLGSTVDTDGKAVTFTELDSADTAALWLRTRDGWRLVDFSAGHTDAFHVVWHEQYGAPKALVGLE